MVSPALPGVSFSPYLLISISPNCEGLLWACCNWGKLAQLRGGWHPSPIVGRARLSGETGGLGNPSLALDSSLKSAKSGVL